jgi:uncharacterized repeat protein (TIGR03803 family)
MDPSALLRLVAPVVAVAWLAAAPQAQAASYTIKVLHQFCATDCSGGAIPTGGLIQDSHGILYGTTAIGGDHLSGTAFELVPNADKSKWTYRVIKQFCSRANCTDGSFPSGPLIMDAAGQFYGTTFTGGKYGGGVFYRLTPEGSGWHWSILYNFCSDVANNCKADGGDPMTGLTYLGQRAGQPWAPDAEPVFGTLSSGGKYGRGLDYELEYDGSAWHFKIIHNIQTGIQPDELGVDDAGNLYGSTANGGKYGDGLLYTLTAGTWHETTLHQFHTGGVHPSGRPYLDAAGNLFGTTIDGGSGNAGEVYERTASGAVSVLYQFCTLANCADGQAPTEAGLVMDSAGNLFGTTAGGGLATCANQTFGCGVAYELSKDQNGHWHETVLADFCSGSCRDGGDPEAPLTLDAQNGNLYGTEAGDGSLANPGSVFELIP